MTDYPKIINGQGVEVVDTSDGAWATYRAEGREQLAQAQAEGAEVRHKLDMLKAEGLHALNSVRFDPEVLADARVQHNQDPAGPSVEAIIETHVVPIRARYLAQFDSAAAPVARKVGEHEMAFLKLIGGSDA